MGKATGNQRRVNPQVIERAPLHTYCREDNWNDDPGGTPGVIQQEGAVLPDRRRPREPSLSAIH